MGNVKTILDHRINMHLELEFSANTDCSDIVFEVYLNDSKIFESTALTQAQIVACDIDETPADHVLKLVMSGKNRRHTQIDSAGEIVSDIYFQINRLEFEELDMSEIFCLGKPCYSHSFNSSNPEFVDEFYGQLGCNGTVCIEFFTPIHLWLLDKF